MIALHEKKKKKQVFFYEREFYCLSNFSSFSIWWKGKCFATSEHAYHWEKFEDEELKELIRNALSAHEALKLAHANRNAWRKDWEQVKCPTMKAIQKEKVRQHAYVEKKLLQTGKREIIEDSWRDDFWGWGPNKDGKNYTGKLWMEIREERVEELRQEYESKRELYYQFKVGQHYLSPRESSDLSHELDILAEKLKYSGKFE